MKTRFIAAAAILLSIVAPASAHRLDEYLQAALISVEKDRVQVSMRLIPGVAVSSVVLASIDTDADGFISSAEQQAYAARVLADLSFTVDGIGVKPKIVSIRFPEIRQIKGGLGEIQIELTAALSAGGLKRRLVLENHHQIKISAYLVNCLVPLDPDIQIIAQNRNELQSFYQLDYVQAGSRANYHPSWWWAAVRGRIGAVGFASIFGLGVRHIAEGTDHLLFLLTLLLPAPLVASGTRWRGCTTVRQSLLRVLGVVTAFTVGHSITLGARCTGTGSCAESPDRSAYRRFNSCLCRSCAPTSFPGTRGRDCSFFRPGSRIGVRHAAGTTRSRAVGACGQHLSVQPGHRDYAVGRRRCFAAVSRFAQSDASVLVAKSWRCTLRGGRSLGMDR